jgi:hypothetical protein
MAIPIVEWYNDIQDAQRILNWIYLSIFVATNLVVLILIKGKIGLWGYCTLFMHFVASFLRLLTPDFSDEFSSDPSNLYYEISFLAQLLIWISIYNFTF